MAGIILRPSWHSEGWRHGRSSEKSSFVGYRNPWVQSVAGHVIDTAISVHTGNDEI